MLKWTIVFLVLGILAVLLDFDSLAESALGIAKILFFVFFVLFVTNLFRSRMRTPID